MIVKTMHLVTVNLKVFRAVQPTLTEDEDIRLSKQRLPYSNIEVLTEALNVLEKQCKLEIFS